LFRRIEQKKSPKQFPGKDGLSPMKRLVDFAVEPRDQMAVRLKALAKGHPKQKRGLRGLTASALKQPKTSFHQTLELAPCGQGVKGTGCDAAVQWEAGKTVDELSGLLVWDMRDRLTLDSIAIS
jgi:hypothetical protein